MYDRRMNPLIRCIYASTATPQFAEKQLPMLLVQARRNNALISVTGGLAYIEGGFFQVLEGEPWNVESLYGVICGDPRHDHVTQIIREPITHRLFGTWPMGIVKLTQSEAAQMIGESNFFKDALSITTLGRTRATNLLNALLNGPWRTAQPTDIFQPSDRVG
jgi:hypothetical protein